MVPADSRRIPRAPRYSGTRYGGSDFPYGAFTLYGRPFQGRSGRPIRPMSRALLHRRRVATSPVWALPRSLATTGGIINLFSLPAGTKMFQFPAFALPTSGNDSPSDCRVVPFGNLRINAYLQLPEAYRSLSRPSSPP
jgi:hypothetical protein